MQCLARLVRVLLGSTAVAEGDDKLKCGAELEVLGVHIAMSENGFVLKPAPDKIPKWSCVLQHVLHSRVFLPGAASKLAGKLSWGGSVLFRRLGRAMLRPIFDQKTRSDGHVSPDLARALQWWLDVLSLDLAERRDWFPGDDPVVHLFTDAAGKDAHLGAVLCCDGCWSWAHMDPPARVLQSFFNRRDNQIMGSVSFIMCHPCGCCLLRPF